MPVSSRGGEQPGEDEELTRARGALPVRPPPAAGALRVHVAGDRRVPAFALAGTDAVRPRVEALRTAIHREAEAATLAHPERHLPAEVERVTDGERPRRAAVMLARDE